MGTALARQRRGARCAGEAERKNGSADPAASSGYLAICRQGVAGVGLDKSIRLVALLIALTFSFGCTGQRAMAPPPALGAGYDPPSRVARLSYISGAVSLRVGGVDEWTAAGRNRPLTSGDAVWTGADGRAELHTGNAALRLDARTAATLLEVGTHATQVKLTEGTASLHVRELDEDEEYEIDTPDAAISILRAGEYRVEVSGTAPGTAVVVRSGSAEVTGEGASFVVRARQEARVPGAAGRSYSITDARPADQFDAFCQDRDRREDRALASKRLPGRMIGYEDIDEYGDWRMDAVYGSMWIPRGVAAGWAPYRFGHWVWMEPWGWTWIDDAPWGFAPFHYGRWASSAGRWGWIPGPFHHRPIYAPALVVFLGGGSAGLRYSFQIGPGPGVAWFPLGPREVWFPPYRASRNYVTSVNITHTVIVNSNTIHQTNIARQRYANRGVENAVTAVPEDVFRRAQPVQRGAIRVLPGEASTAAIAGGAPAVAPTRESLIRGDRRVGAPVLSRERQPVIVNRQPPPAPVPFEQRRPELEASPGRVPDRSRSEDLRRPQPLPPPQYKQEPRRQPRESTRPAPPARPAPPTDRRRDQQWERNSTREEMQRQNQIQRERQQVQRAPGKVERRK